MKITEYIPFIAKEFQEIKEDYKLSWNKDNNEYLISLSNEFVDIEFSTERGEFNTNMSIIFTDVKKDQYYHIWDIQEKKGIQNLEDVLSSEEKVESKKHKETIMYIIYIYSRLLGNYCQDMLSGDFSQVGPGLSN
ncbi:hypothetical protein [uncultured Dokdonia sp.]|uniref:hypothetical protein n=1 Tax=uncultured Dokdonia sp. TaxID=575653 RepID=UPI0026150ED7|nr:hypothetical protein [uncultured Dokdonia sp.]